MDSNTAIEGSAPLEIRFTDESKGHITAWEWDFGNATAVERDPFHLFTVVGVHKVSLRVANTMTEFACESTDSVLTVSITEMELEAPNTFTPNGDGANDEFRIYYKSVKNFSMVIFNRWGRKVYESTDPAEGWDGTIANGMADPGVYFYVIEAEGYNRNEKKKLQGPIHLIRGKN
ncbi:gliding motility-associated C-terminal domain-containing protein [Geofilum rubicundum]|nr:gliding motility-associated C-terminal domain-containing protein [Geofilum rubicundum]